MYVKLNVKNGKLISTHMRNVAKKCLFRERAKSAYFRTGTINDFLY